MVKTLTLVAALAFAVPVSGQTPAPQGPPVIVTTGEGSVKMAPDRAWVTIATETRDQNPEASQNSNATATAAVIAHLKSSGIGANAIQTSGYTLQPEFDYVRGGRKLRDYVARNQIEVRVDALAKLGEILAAAVSSGATNVSDVRFDLKNREAVERQALTEAVRDARARADAIADGAGVQIERVLRIEEEPVRAVQPLPRFSMAEQVSVAGAPPPVPIESGEIEIHAQVTLTAAIK